MNVVKNEVPIPRDDKNMVSILETIHVETGERKVVKEFDGVIIEAPNWLKTEAALIYNSQGKIWKIRLDDALVTQIDTAYCEYCNNDHVLSPNHKWIAVSHQTKEDLQSRIYVIPMERTLHPTLITPIAPSYLHGWSPDGSTLAYCAERNGQYDIYTISVEGGLETQLTNTPWLDDGPEYAPDSQIWFNSVRSGLMQIWKMNPDGSNPVQMVNEESNDWFPHVSPDGTKVSFISYKKGDVEPGDHPANKQVEIKLMNSDGSNLKTIVELFGGQGTMNVNSWSPDSKSLAFVSYRRK